MSFNFKLDNITNILLDDNKTIIITLTNYGYLLYTLNMLKSLMPYGLDKKVFVVCIDKKSFNTLQKLGYNCYCIDNKELSRFCAWNTKGYDKICYIKLNIIYSILLLNLNMILIDGDIVFRHNPLDDISEWLNDKTHDIWVQNDSNNDSNTNNMCTGYMMIKSNENIVKLYDCISEEGIAKYNKCAFDNNDQSYFNVYIKPFCKVKGLPLNKYPNGKVFYDNFEKLNNIILVHFNWIKGHLKMAKIKEHKMWLLTPEEEDEI